MNSPIRVVRCGILFLLIETRISGISFSTAFPLKDSMIAALLCQPEIDLLAAARGFVLLSRWLNSGAMIGTRGTHNGE